MRETSYQFTTHDSQQPKAFRGGERKVMKKSLSLLLAFALVFSMFSSLAFAADSTSVADKLVNAGIIKGTKSGDLKENETWKRQDVTVIIARLLGKEAEAQNTAKNHSFADVKDLYYDGFITYAYENGYFTGHSDIRFGYGEDITVKQFVAVMLRVLGYDVEWDEVEEVAVEVGLVPANTDFNKAATRGEYFVIIDSTLQTEVAEGGQTLGEKLGLEGYVDEEDEADQAITSFKAVGAKKLEVRFAAPVDESKDDITVKRGSINVNISKTTYSEDKKVVTLETTTKLTKGDYTVIVKGLTENDLTATTSVEDERVAKIEFTSDKAPLVKNGNTINYKEIYTWIKVENQYGENIVKDVSLTLTASKGNPSLDTTNGTVKITSTTDYVLNEKVTLSAVHVQSQSYASALLTVSPPAQVSTIDIKELVKNNNATLNVLANPSDFWLVVEAKDQYGNDVPASQVGQDILVSVSNPNVLNLKTTTVGGETQGVFTTKDGKTVIELAKANNVTGPNNFGKGVATVIMMSRTTGSQDTIEIEVIDKPVVDKIDLSAPDLAVAGEVIKIPFTAVDQFGNEFSNGNDLKDGLRYYSVSGPGLDDTKLLFKTDYVNKKAYIELDARSATNTDDAIVFITVQTGTTGEFEQLSFTLQEPKKAEVVVGVKDLNPAMGIGASFQIANDKIRVLDQFGREHTLDAFGSSYSADISVNNSNVTLTGNTITANTKGSAEVTIKLLDSSSKPVANSDFVQSIQVVEPKDIENFTVSEVATIYAGGTAYGKALNVEGVLANGTKVTLPKPTSVTADTYTYYNAFYSITESYSGLEYDLASGKLVYVDENAAGSTAKMAADGLDDDKEKEFVVIVTGKGKTVEHKPVTVKVSRINPVVTTIKVVGGTHTVKENDDLITIQKSKLGLSKEAIAKDAIELVDQYGVSFTNEDAQLASVLVSNDNYSTLNAGDTFTLTIITKNNVVKQLTVLVVE